MSVERTYKEINERIKSARQWLTARSHRQGAAQGISRTAQEVDVVTTGTFGPMCSSGVFLISGHPQPRMRMSKVWLNNVPAYGNMQ